MLFNIPVPVKILPGPNHPEIVSFIVSVVPEIDPLNVPVITGDGVPSACTNNEF